MKVQSTQHFENFSLIQNNPSGASRHLPLHKGGFDFCETTKNRFIDTLNRLRSGAVDFMFACFAPKSGFFALFFLRFVVRLYRGGYLLVVIEDIDND